MQPAFRLLASEGSDSGGKYAGCAHCAVYKVEVSYFGIFWFVFNFSVEELMFCSCVLYCQDDLFLFLVVPKIWEQLCEEFSSKLVASSPVLAEVCRCLLQATIPDLC